MSSSRGAAFLPGRVYRVNAGRLKHVITIQQKTSAKDPDYGGQNESWVDFATDVRAGKIPLQGREFFAAKAAQSEAEVVFLVRYIPGITADMRIVHDGLYYDIAGPPVDPEGRHRELHIMTKEGVTKG